MIHFTNPLQAIFDASKYDVFNCIHQKNFPCSPNNTDQYLLMDDQYLLMVDCLKQNESKESSTFSK